MDAYQTARMWHNLGVSVLPILRGTKKPALSSWKQYQESLPSEADLRAWFDGSGYSIAVITGRGLVIVDFDNIDRHREWVNSLPVAALSALNTYRVKTARGFHYYWWLSEACDEWHGDGVDVKARGYCLCPPSVHPSGIEYRGFGSINDIGHIERITDLLPDYKPHQEWQQPSEPSQRDIFDEAMKEHTPLGTSIEDIKARVSIEDLLNLPRVRHFQHVNCMLPGHKDTHASFVVYPDHFWCYGCNRGGDVITLHSLLFNVDISDSLRELAKRIGQ